MPVLAKIKKNILFLGAVAGNYLVFLPVFRLFEQRFPEITNVNTDICIDGYPRSGNSYFVSVFLHWNPGSDVSHHTHLAGSTKYSLPNDDKSELKKKYLESVLASPLYPRAERPFLKYSKLRGQ